MLTLNIGKVRLCDIIIVSNRMCGYNCEAVAVAVAVGVCFYFGYILIIVMVVVGFVIAAAGAIFLAALVVVMFVGGVCCCRGRCWTGVIKACSTSHPSGNQVDGLPLVAHMARAAFKHDVLAIPPSHHDARLE